ncbi:MAG: excinuclease ABC subunit B [Candidatus Yonathbacteria bacterium RIFOXYC1_FULL_52_10]|uniref:UvrABC system protein B n=1 Tax=Candidatus Yonathbacteria bacterium RIFOXYD1_FULL_52_36 TaxID=1802730 RepID=A0A1G2SJ27_9BACT|nr:MAG: excinuclease ABC subunit B [Candidatus Yonathbacteria bacterium RIFOXYC1_FULL_52_10]OHA85016.1 MAG: excinuclease ABC subunit B [Candidatus Yonathbacteria bacterium RIFOXYD1_FULL_52_36]
MNKFVLKSEYEPAGDQPEAIEALVKGLKKGMPKQTLLGVTGSGKTFTVANVIERVQKPTLIIAHNKTLAAQLAQEYREVFPDNAVHYFVSYYDYYQPEAYLPTSDTYIEKDAQINEEIDRLRHATTQALLTRPDVIIVASVSCIYGIGSPEEYKESHLLLKQGDTYDRRSLMQKLVAIFYERTNADLTPGTFRATGNTVEIMPISERVIYELTLLGGVVSNIAIVDATSRALIEGSVKEFFLFPAKHFITTKAEQDRAVKSIRKELTDRLKVLEKEGKILEAERLKRRTNYDLAMIKEVGYCNGIENYSRHLSGHAPGEPPNTLLSYFPHKPDGTPDFLTVIDESHVTLPQIGGMYGGDQSRKKTLIEHGFRLPSAADNRPLRAEEFWKRVGQTLFVSATPSQYERDESAQIVEQIIRPTGLIDPIVEIKPIVEKGAYKGQIKDFIAEAEVVIKKGDRVIATTLTKRMAEDLSIYLKERGVASEYLHSDVKTIDRIKILTEFRRGTFDCIVGVNLLREGLDLPEVSLIGILDADKEGFLRSETSLIQIIGRAARNSAGRVILYADTLTGSIERALRETNRRREIQTAHNKAHGITPQTIKKKIHDITEHLDSEHDKAVRANLALDREIFKGDKRKLVRLKEKQMTQAVKELDFETAAILRDEIKVLKGG